MTNINHLKNNGDSIMVEDIGKIQEDIVPEYNNKQVLILQDFEIPQI